MSELTAKGLKKYFGKTKALKGIGFEIEKGEVFGFLGPNGAGKTTAIRCILDFIRPSAGEISLLGFSSKDPNYHLSRREVGYLVQGNNLVENWTGKDHIAYQQDLYEKSPIIDNLVRRFGFDPKPKVKNLSTGNRQKLGLILALMHQPKLLILDEPTAGLDPILQEEFYRMLKELSFKGVTTLMSSHNLAEVEKICSRVAMIKSGKIVTVKKISDLEGKKIHSIRITFKKEINKSEIEDKNIKVVEVIPGGFLLNVKGQIDDFVKKISKFSIESLTISQANLEEIFLEYYKK